MTGLKIMQNERIDQGTLQINVTSSMENRPIQGATVKIGYSGEGNKVMEEVVTNVSGLTESVVLDTPPLEYSLEPDQPQPYSEITLQIEAEGFESVNISGVEILPTVEALQNIKMEPKQGKEEEILTIPPHTLYYPYPPKIAEAEIKQMGEPGEIVLSRVVIPEYVIVHDGPPMDSSAQNYYVKYKDYIKNVASSEIYATWPESTIRANVLAIMSFTLNRVYTEWYRNKGYSFTITSSTAYDHKWINGRNYFDSISEVVDEVFSDFLSRPGVRQPILTQYCDGQRVSCPNWMSQWGSKYLGDQGYNTIDILRYYYGEDIYVNSAEEISGIPSSWPGRDLITGSSGQKVLQLQEELNAISKVYTEIPMVEEDGYFGSGTKEAVEAFQNIFGLPASGIVDFPTWYKISDLYVAVTRIAEL